MAERHSELDSLRVLAVLMLIYYHGAGFFTHWGSIIENDRRSLGMDLMVMFMDQWYMPLFFFLSGMATCFSLRVRSAGAYARERLRRLLVPFIFGTLVVIPPQVYCERLQDASLDVSFLHFYRNLFNGLYPHGNFSWHHLWFIGYLLLLSMAALPLFLFLGQGRGRNLIGRLAQICQGPGMLLALAIPLVITESALRFRYYGIPDFIHDWANVCFYFGFFVYGFLLASEDRFAAALDRQWPWMLAVGLTASTLGGLLFLTGRLPGYNGRGMPGFSAEWVLVMLLRVTDSWAWVLTFWGLARRFLNMNTPHHPTLRYASEASYPFYILHMTILVLIGMPVLRLPLGVAPKYLILTTSTLVTTLVVYDVLVRRTGVTRFLFGMRPARPADSRGTTSLP